jgi:radical SAM family uncharacterized protein/radical SAM-linked protein
MRQKSIQEILHQVQQPSRYLGTETNRIKKEFSSVKLKVLLAFPDLYEIGTSHFGIQILYHILNSDPDILAERVFAPAVDMEARMIEGGIPLSSLESGRPLDQFDIIGFSLLYEMNYTNVLGMLSLGRIPLLSAERREKDPLVIAGGPCTSNPEPVADFFDAITIGDGENTVLEIAETWLRWKAQGDNKKNSLLEEWGKIEGVYIPGRYKAEYSPAGYQTLYYKNAETRKEAVKIVRRAIIPELRVEDVPDRPVVPFGKPIHDRLRVEVARGCSRGCRFCQAGMIYRPVRERSVSQLLSVTEKALATTGYEDISLLSLSTGDYSGIVPLMQTLMGRCEAEHIAVSFPSLRAGTMSPELMELVKKVRKTGFTMAVEAGSQRLRNVINKNIEQKDIFKMVADAFQLGWQVIKLYFMVGLPTENPKDLEELVDLVKEIHGIRGPKGRKGKINVSVNTFIPKPYTPFQWVGQISANESREKIEALKDRLRLSRVKVKWQNPESSFLEGLWARGDRRLSKLLLAAYNKGCRFDGWSDQFQYGKWVEAIEEVGINADFFVTRSRDIDEPLPWDPIDMGIEKSFLKKEWKKATEEAVTPDCREDACSQCGVCDHKTIRPRLEKDEATTNLFLKKELKPEASFLKKLTVTYEKLGPARFFGHLELVNIFIRAIRRSRIPVFYSQGFHPMPKISFDDPLPLGYESLKETFQMKVSGGYCHDNVAERLNKELPEGLRVTECGEQGIRPKERGSRVETYEVRLHGQPLDQGRIDGFKAEEKRLFKRRSRKGKVSEIDLKKAVHSMEIIGLEKIRIALSTETGMTVRPAYVLKEVFDLSEETIRDAIIIKTETAYV